MVFCPICKEELVKPQPKEGHYHKFLLPSKCKNNHEFMVAIVAGHLSIKGNYYQSSTLKEAEPPQSK